MLPPLQLARLCAEVYDTAQGWAHRWDVSGVVVGHQVIAGQDVLVFRGSDDALDWLRDFEALPVVDLEVGAVHAGFLAGLDDALEQIQPVLAGPVVLTGHSLGGARARIAAAKLITRGVRVAQLCVFGSPKPGFGRLPSIIRESCCLHSSYRNMDDPVPLQPPGPFWEHTEGWTALSAPAPEPGLLDDLREHSCGLYVKGLAALAKTASP